MYLLCSNIPQQFLQEQAIFEISDTLKQSLDKKLVTYGAFLDFSKAFDTVGHKILLSKLYHYGTREIPLNWVENGISNDWACELGKNIYFVGKWYKAIALGLSIMGNDTVVNKMEFGTWYPSGPSEPTINLWLVPSFFPNHLCWSLSHYP